MALHELLWKEPLPLPRGVELRRQDSIVVPQRGPGGSAVYDLVQVQLPQGQVPVLMAYRAPLFPVDIPRLRDRLLQLDAELRLRESSVGRALPMPRVPMIATDVASTGIIDACEREGVALVDLRGTLLLRSERAFVRVQGQGQFKRTPRAPVFHGKGCRLVRVLLDAPGETWTVRRLGELTQTGYAYAHGVATRLEQDGYLERAPKRAGLRVRDPAGLLRAWLYSNQRTAVVVDAFNAPATTAEALQRGFSELETQGIRAIFTLASGLQPVERFASGLPHGLYLSGSIEPVVQAFGLRRITPHNFLVMRPEVAAETEAGGVYFAPRRFPHGPGVALPQLIVDFHLSGGRGKEQAEALLERYVKALPLSEEPVA
ncbi:hypothetical protein [Archangium lipolyticum]|uniref:hypothetical protein n=1 Tax=Archangium lipolyticum TaxID=2970465 RepID=UPI002149E9C4|nr:hypothetical protein [Archangium lipolyticum]